MVIKRMTKPIIPTAEYAARRQALLSELGGAAAVGPFYVFASYLSDLGYPGPDPWFNPSPVTNTKATVVFQPAFVVPATGRNMSFLPGQVAPGIGPGVYIQKIGYSAGWAGGQWATSLHSLATLSPHSDDLKGRPRGIQNLGHLI